jgi:hypothetical protein
MGLPKFVLDVLDRVGIPWNQIDHVVVGLTLPSGDVVPQVVAAVVLTAPPVEESTVWKAIGAERVSGGKHPRYKAMLGMQAVQAKPNAFVFASKSNDLDGIESMSAVNGENLRPALREAIIQRLDPASFAWLVAVGDDRWADLPSAKFLAKWMMREDLLARFAPGRAVAIGLSLQPDPRLHVAVNAEDARPVADWFAQQLAGDDTVVEPGEKWAVVTVPCPLSDVAAKLGKLIPPERK